MEQYIGKRVRYEKSGTRKGWEGVISTFTHEGSRVLIEYDNGLQQAYRTDAIIPSGAEDCTYLKLIENATNAAPQLGKSPYIAVDGALVEGFVDEASAVEWATAQVVHSRGFKKVPIYKACCAVQTKIPDVEVINDTV